MREWIYKQMSLQVSLQDEARFENLYLPKGCHIAKQLKQQLNRKKQWAIMVYGMPASGVSHLLQSACYYAQQKQTEIAYVPLKKWFHCGVDLFAKLYHLDLVVIDDLQLMAGKADWEEALFHLYNRAQQSGTRLLMSAHCLPGDFPILLPDLKSRLQASFFYVLPSLTDEEKCQLLVMRAKLRGLLLSEDSARYILQRAARTVSELMLLLQQLDQASLDYKRPLTIPFIKKQLGF